MGKTKKIILIVVLAIALIFAVKFTMTINEVNREIDELKTMAMSAGDTFTASEAARVNEITKRLKDIDNGIWGFMINNDVQRLPVTDGMPDQYLIEYKSVN